MTVRLKKPKSTDLPIVAVDAASFDTRAAALAPAQRQWLAANGFKAQPHRHVLLPAESGAIAAVWLGVTCADDPWALASLPDALPPGRYRLDGTGVGAGVGAEAAAWSWTLGGYAFDRYRARRREPAELVLADTPPARRGALLGRVANRVRDLVNTPAEAMGPADLARAVRELAKAHGARFRQVVGDALLEHGFPAIHAVGRAADHPKRAPRLIELNWGKPAHPRLTLVGKGVCFDTGGLDLKTSSGMRLMKKDMGGAAHALGLAELVMSLGLPVRLQLLVPAVENAVAANAYRPGDIFRTRSGLAIEIGNTDAEGRVILCDALSYGAESGPALMIDLATLTGAARTALGAELPALFCRDLALARELVDTGLAIDDPLWHLPLWAPYHASIESPIADIVNTGKTALAGAITAALFLADFVPAQIAWLHLDLFAWNDRARPGRPVGGEAMALRTLLAHLERRFGG